MSLIIPRNFKRAKAQGAQDAQGDEVIAQKNGYKLVHNTLNDGYWFYTKSGAGWGIKATNKIAAINEFNRLVGSAKDAAELNNDAELRVVHAKGIGKWWVEPNLSRFNDADRERTFKGRKEFPDREAAMKYARGTGKTFIVNDACEDSGELNNDADLRAADSIAATGDSNDDSILRLCKPSNVIKKAKMGNLHEVRYGAGYIYPLIGRDKVLLKVFGSLSEANRSPLVAADSRAADSISDK